MTPIRADLHRRRLWSDRAATDPILVIAAIAVSLVLLVGGSFAVTGMMNNGKDLNAKSDLDKIATAETAAQASDQSYLGWASDGVSGVLSNTDGDGLFLNERAVGFTLSPGTRAAVRANATSWVAGAQSATGTVFWRSSKSSKIYTETIPSSAYDASLTLPPVAG